MKLCRWIPLAGLLLASGAWSGCASRSTGYRISDETVAFIQPGVTSRAEVVENLGPPLIELPDPRVMAYSWGKVRLTANKAPAAQTGMSQPNPIDYGSSSYLPDSSPIDNSSSYESRRWICCVALDANGRVIRFGKFEVPPATSLEAAVRKWAALGQ